MTPHTAEKPVFPPWPVFDPEMVEASARPIASGKCNYWTGQEGKAFETEFAKYVESPYAIAVANGSAALECALNGLGIGSGDEVVVTCRSFIASVSAVVMRGAIPVFADVERDSQGLSAATIEPVLTPKTKAILPVHIAGWACDMDPILDLARSRNLHVIEDVAQALGGRYKGKMLGSLAETAAFSFCQDKILTTGGEGGMVVARDRDVWKRAWGFKDHGKEYDTVFKKTHPPGYRWLHESFGANLRMTEMQSAIGRVALQRLPEWLHIRRRNAEILTSYLDQSSAIRVPKPPAHVEHAYYKFYALVQPEALREGWSRDRIMAEVNALGIPCLAGYGEMYLEKAFENTPYRPAERLPIARELADTSLMFLVHPTLNEEHMSLVGEKTLGVLRQACR